MQDIRQGIKYLGFQLKPNSYKKEYWKWLIAKNRKKTKQLELYMVIESRQTHPDEISTRSYTSVLDVTILDPKRSTGKNQKDLCSFHLVRHGRKVYTALVKMGQYSFAKSLRRPRAQKHFSLLKGTNSKILLEAHFSYQHVDACNSSKIYFPGYN